MAFLDERLPEDIERGFSGGPQWSVSIGEAASGFEQRNLNSPSPRSKWSASLPLNSQAEIDALLAFWYSVSGPLHSWRFRDWTSYYAGMKWVINGSGLEELVHTDGDSSPILPEQFAVSDGTTTTQYQLTKKFQTGALSYLQKVTKPVSTIKIWVETSVGSGVYAERTTNFTVNYLTGKVQFTSSAPTNGKKIGWSGMYDLPVRFANDSAQLAVDFAQSGTFPVEVIEVLE